MTEFGYGGDDQYLGGSMDESGWRDGGSYDSSGRRAPDILPDGAYDSEVPAGIAYDTGNLPAIPDGDTAERVVPAAFRHNDAHTSEGDYASRIPRELFDATGNPDHHRTAVANKPAGNEPSGDLFRHPDHGNAETDPRHHGYDMDAQTIGMTPVAQGSEYNQADEPVTAVPAPTTYETPAPGVYYSDHAAATYEAEPEPEPRDFEAEARAIIDANGYTLTGKAHQVVVTAIAKGLKRRADRTDSEGQSKGRPQAPTFKKNPGDYTVAQPESAAFPPTIYRSTVEQDRDELAAFSRDPLGAPLPGHRRPSSLEDAPPATFQPQRSPHGQELMEDVPLPPAVTPNTETVGQLPPDPRSARPDTGLAGFIEQCTAELRAAEASGKPEPALQIMRERLEFLQGQIGFRGEY